MRLFFCGVVVFLSLLILNIQVSVLVDVVNDYIKVKIELILQW